MSDYRVNYLLQHYADKTFKIDQIVDGNIFFISEDGKELALKCSIPRRIVSEEDGKIIEVTKSRLSMKDKPAETPAAAPEAQEEAPVDNTVPPDNVTPLGEGPNAG